VARQREKAPAVERLILDSGAVIALSRGDDRALAYLKRAVELDAQVWVPVAVLAETLRGHARDAAVHRILNAIGRTRDTTVAMGRRAGALLGSAGGTNTVDALVVAEAIDTGGADVLTGDPADLAALAAGYPEVRIFSL
jgi:predicted nucleic acid-binding protein